MNTYKRHRFHPSIISYAVWVYYRFNLSFRDIKDLLAEKGLSVSYESIRLWCIKFGPAFARKLKHKHVGFGDTFYLDAISRTRHEAVQVAKPGSAISNEPCSSIQLIQSRQTPNFSKPLSP